MNNNKIQTMKLRTRLCTLMAATLTALPLVAQEKTPAFPGAEGFGRYVTGGRGGTVYHVTNLNDTGDGSLRWALGKSGVKTIVFDVSGTIHLASALNIPSNTTIAGQTAPGDGICVADYPCTIKGNNVIVRYMRFRLGNKNVTQDGADGWDGFGGFDQQDWMIDHCSVSWSIDECLSVLGNRNTTVQWCISAQSLVNAGHSKGAHGYGGNWGGSGASFHHNLIVHHGSRTPRLGPRPTTQLDERMDMRNNVIYNFGGNGCYGGEGMNVNIVNNYYKPGPATKSGNYQKRIAGLGIRTTKYVTDYPAYAPALHLWGKYFVDGNVNPKYSDVTNDNWTYGIYNQISSTDNDGLYNQAVKDSIRLQEPISFILTTTHTAQVAYERVLSYAGASLHRDSFDELMVADTRNGAATYTGSGLSQGLINSQEDNKPADAGSDWSAWPTLNSTAAPTDTDGDGMPDEWETAHGLNPANSADGIALTAEGYTQLEVYLNSLVAAITEAQNADGEQLGLTQNVGNDPVISDYEISQQTSNGDATFSNGFSSSNTEPAFGSDGTIKYSRNKQYSLTVPDGIEITAATFYGYCNANGATGYLGELAGKTFSTTDYIFPARDASVNRATYTITFDAPVKNKLTFTPKGDAQSCYKITLHAGNSAGIDPLNTNSRPIQVRYYSTDGTLLAAPRPGLNIEISTHADGTRVSRKLIVR